MSTVNRPSGQIAVFIKPRRITEAKCWRHLSLNGIVILLAAAYGADEIRWHEYAHAAAPLAAAVSLAERFQYWLDYKRALRSANPTLLPPLVGVRFVRFDQEPFSPGSSRTRTVAIVQPINRPRSLLAIIGIGLLCLVLAIIAAICLTSIFPIR